MSRRDVLALQDYLGHIQQALGRIRHYLQGISYSEFLVNDEKQDAVIRNLEIVGEAANNIQRHFPDFVTTHPDFPISNAYGMRNILSHGYYQISLDIVWKTIQQNLPDLELQVENAISQTGPNKDDMPSPF